MCCEVGCGALVWSSVIPTVSQTSSLFVTVCKQMPGNILKNKRSTCSHFPLALHSASFLNLCKLSYPQAVHSTVELQVAVSFAIPQLLYYESYWALVSCLPLPQLLVSCRIFILLLAVSSRHSSDVFSCPSEWKQFHFFGYLCCLLYFF